ncbi:hypothetical protein E6C27_scaffold60G004060 [Cucumis melo var. makuwa]|uniref:Uncharacterized protein n=1 Tax=Cucumis melo var. makuwa TaxID=1194695 RepID=A0A5A7U7P6_CUCMM|nr:hypothetical protein E6C27_scaffold60G004060 [Cucumis melo var. makuwa]
MPYNQRRGGRGEQKWKEKAEVDRSPTESEAAAELTNQATPGLAHRAIWKPKAYGTTSGAAVIEGEKAPTNGTSTENKGSNAGLAVQGGVVGLSQLCKSNQIEKFIVDNSAYTHEEIRATFYPKFENEKSDQEIKSLKTFSFLFFFDAQSSVQNIMEVEKAPRKLILLFGYCLMEVLIQMKFHRGRIGLSSLQPWEFNISVDRRFSEAFHFDGWMFWVLLIFYTRPGILHQRFMLIMDGWWLRRSTRLAHTYLSSVLFVVGRGTGFPLFFSLPLVEDLALKVAESIAEMVKIFIAFPQLLQSAVVAFLVAGELYLKKKRLTQWMARHIGVTAEAAVARQRTSGFLPGIVPRIFSRSIGCEASSLEGELSVTSFGTHTPRTSVYIPGIVPRTFSQSIGWQASSLEEELKCNPKRSKRWPLRFQRVGNARIVLETTENAFQVKETG